LDILLGQIFMEAGTMAKKTYECRGCGTMLQIEEKDTGGEEKKPRCTLCSSYSLTEISEEELQALLNPTRCSFR
jgi:hypothetical protein